MLACITSVFLPEVIQLGREKELARPKGFPVDRCKCFIEINCYDLIKHQSVMRFSLVLIISKIYGNNQNRNQR